MSELWRATSPDQLHISDTFSEKIHWCTPIFKTRQSSRPWFHLARVYNSCKSCFEVLVMWLSFFLLVPTQNSQNLEKSTVFTIPKLMNLMGDPKSYQQISLLCVKPIIDPLLPKKQAKFQHRKSTLDQIVLLIQSRQFC